MQLPATFDDLIAAADQYDLYVKLIRQLNKDLLLSNIDLQFNEDAPASSLKYMLHETIYQLIQERFAEYLNLLYIIDVPDSKIRRLDGSDVLRLSEQVTFLILQREWQKVWYKQQYS